MYVVSQQRWMPSVLRCNVIFCMQRINIQLWVPKQLTEGQMYQCIDISFQFLEWHSRSDGGFSGTDVHKWYDLDASYYKIHWFHYIQALLWTTQSSLEQSAKKLVVTVFWDAKGVLLRDFITQGQPVNQLHNVTEILYRVDQVSPKPNFISWSRSIHCNWQNLKLKVQESTKNLMTTVSQDSPGHHSTWSDI